MNWLRKVFGVRPPSRRQAPRRRVVLQLEALETRTLLSVAAPTPAPAVPTLTPAVSPALTIPGYTPTQIRHAYGIDAINLDGVVGNGAGQTIAIIDAYYDPDIYSDLTTFDQQYGLPTPGDQTTGFMQETYTQTTPPAGTNWYLETSLDVEWAHAVAPAADILLVEAADSSFASMLGTAANWARSQPGVSAVCLSLYTRGDQTGETAYDSILTTPAGHNGVTFVAAAGDAGSPAGYPTLSPNVLSVGGTSLTINGDNYGGETVWDDSYGPPAAASAPWNPGRATRTAWPTWSAAAAASRTWPSTATRTPACRSTALPITAGSRTPAPASAARAGRP